MRERERQNDGHEREQQPAGGTPGGGNLEALGVTAERLLAAGDDAIERALSGNSDAFLAANRQQGGQ